MISSCWKEPLLYLSDIPRYQKDITNNKNGGKNLPRLCNNNSDRTSYTVDFFFTVPWLQKQQRQNRALWVGRQPPITACDTASPKTQATRGYVCLKGILTVFSSTMTGTASIELIRLAGVAFFTSITVIPFASSRNWPVMSDITSVRSACFGTTVNTDIFSDRRIAFFSSAKNAQ